MKLAIHLASAYFARAGHPAPGHEAGAAEHARGAVIADVGRVIEQAWPRWEVIVAIPHPAKGRPFRSALAQGWRREQDEGGKTERAAVLWQGLEQTAAELAAKGARIVAPAAYLDGHMLDIGGGEAVRVSGMVASSRDVVATLARQHREAADGSEFRIVTTRPSVAALLSPEHSISVAVLVDGAWQVMTKPQQLAAWRGWHPRPTKATDPLPVDRVPRALLADYEALTMIHRVGPETAVKLLRPGGRWRSAEQAALAAVATPEGKRTEAQRRLVEMGARELLELLAVAGLRDDVPIVGAPLAPRRNDGLVGDQEQGERALPHDDRHGAALRAAPRAGDPLRLEEERAEGVPAGATQVQAGAPEAPPAAADREAPRPAEAPVAPPVLDDNDLHRAGQLPTDPAEGCGPALCPRCGTPTAGGFTSLGDRCTACTPDAPQTPAPSPPAERHEKETRKMSDQSTEPTPIQAPAEPPRDEAAPLPAPPPRAPEDATTALAVRPHTPAPLVVDPSTADWALALQPRDPAEAWQMAKHLHASELFVKKFDSIAAIWTVICLGREHGMSAMAALQSMHCIEGKVEMSAELIVAKILRSGLAHYFTLVESTDERATWETHRKGDKGPLAMSFTVAEAERREIFKVQQGKRVTVWGKPSQWQKMPDVMCMWRAATKLARAKYPDVVRGLYGQGEIRETRGDVIDGEFEP